MLSGLHWPDQRRLPHGRLFSFQRAWVDQRSYATPDADLGDLVAGSDGYPSSSRRLQISKTIYLNNEGA